MTELQSGVLLGRYELLVRVGRGGMASVWVARERSTVSGKQRLVAIKAMLPELAHHTQFRAMFLREVQIIQAIQHDHVVRVFEVSEDRGTLYMVMEWVEGDSLRNLVRAAKRRGAMPAELAVRLAIDAASGLHAAHELRDWNGEPRGIVHCDVSPHNILVGIDGKAKLVDFGIANALGSLESESDTELIKGKLSYMSPEQTRGERLDRRTDVFALGIVLFEMTTGEQLFKGRDAAHTLELVRSGPIPRPSSLNPRFPARLESVVMRALERDRSRRYQSAQEFGEALSNYLYEERILVAHAAVAQLLQRVIGQRIDKRREVIERIVQAMDGELRTGQVGPHQLAALADLAPMHSDPFNITLTNAAGATQLGLSARLEMSALTAAPMTSTLPPPASASPASPRAPMPWLRPLILGSSTVIAATLGFTIASHHRRAEPTVEAPRPSAVAGKSVPPESVSTVTQKSDVTRPKAPSAEDLPLAVEPQLRADSRSQTVSKATSDRSSATSESGDGAANSEPTPLTLDEDPSAATLSVFNRPLAHKALMAQARATHACRDKGDGPRGEGRAAVTFANNGHVSNVVLPPQFNGTAIGACVAGQFRQTRAPAFGGESVTLYAQFNIPE